MRTASLLAPIMGVFLSACSATAMGPFTVFADPGEYEFHSCEQLAAIRPSFKGPRAGTEAAHGPRRAEHGRHGCESDRLQSRLRHGYRTAQGARRDGARQEMRYPGRSVRDASTLLAFGCCQAVPRWYGHGAADRGAGGGMTALLFGLPLGPTGLRGDCRAVRAALSHGGALQSDGQSGLFLTYAMASSRSFSTSTPGRCAISIIRLASAVRTSDAIAGSASSI